MKKNRDREKAVFANINLQGPCNYKCFFCLGNDINCNSNYLKVHFSKWKNFNEYLEKCKKNKIKKIYLTGQNTDPLLYKYLSELIEYLKKEGFIVGIRTNGVKALERQKEIESCNGGVSYSIHSLDSKTNYLITKSKQVLDIKNIDKKIEKDYRVAIVINRYNKDEILDMIKELSKLKKLRYIQLRWVSTDNRYYDLKEDIKAFDELSKYIENNYECIDEFYKAKIYDIFGIKTSLWKTVKTSINSFNYFTEGIISENYFVVEGYLQGREK